LRKALIILSLISVWGCAPGKYVTERSVDPGGLTLEDVVNKVKRNNLSEESFYIEKASVYVNINNKAGKYLFSVKFIKPDKFLISIRNTGGIEGARVYLTKDSVQINDRIGKRIIIGKLKDVDRITGFPYALLNTLFGDLVLYEGRQKDDITKFPDSVVIKQGYNGKELKSVLDPGIGKVISTTVINENNKVELTISYSRFGRSDNHIPGVIEVKDSNRNFSAQIKIEKVQPSWKGEIEFIPGKGYRKEEIK
jgi:hypothetical protein